jgi:feruloyl-CoA synthase
VGTNPRPIRPVRLGPRDVEWERDADGALLLRSPHPLPAYPRKLTEKLEYWAARAPDRLFLAQRDASGGWRSIMYSQALEQARRVGAYLLGKNLSAERPLMVLSGNDIEHALLHLGAMYVGVPYAPVSPAYSLPPSDFSKLRFIHGLMTPGLVYAKGEQYAKALSVLQTSTITDFDAFVAEPASAAVEAAHARVGPDTIAKFLFTSGTTGSPKAVIITQRMWCANQAMLATLFAFFREEPPVIVGWAPWHHAAAGCHDLGLVLYNGGSYYVDEGKPMPGAIEATVRNLREIAPTWYFNVPKGYEALLPYLKADAALRRNFFSRLRLLWFAAAALPQHLFDEIKEHIKSIARIQLRILQARLARMDFALEVSDAALGELAKVGFDPVYGARPLKRAIQSEIENPLAKAILEGRFAPKDTIQVDWRGGKMVFEKKKAVKAAA